MLKPLTGSRKQIEWATELRGKAVQYLDKEFWTTEELWQELIEKLPTDFNWWIENKKHPHEAARIFLGLEYITPPGADY